MANGDGGTNGAKGPWWAELIRTFGPTAAIAVFLVWMMAGQVIPMLQQMTGIYAIAYAADVRPASKRSRTTRRSARGNGRLIAELEKSEHHDREAALALEQQTCINVAKSAYQVQKCQDVRDTAEAQ